MTAMVAINMNIVNTQPNMTVTRDAWFLSCWFRPRLDVVLSHDLHLGNLSGTNTIRKKVILKMYLQ
jgi:hypothetical protein